MAVLLGAVKPVKKKYSKSFEKWILSDSVIKISPNSYLTQDSQWRIKYTKPQLYKYFMKEYIS